MIKLSLGWLHFDLIIGKGLSIDEMGDENIWFRVELSHTFRQVGFVLPFVGVFFYAAGRNLPPVFSTWKEMREPLP
ncbi:hypothetical protein [Oceanidesulfovibrio marinus]|uniref:Uncharacterized protein n=1 Tax=Oceanidesulfovibrio marinus TaxID=370038 RepID=A0A6P1ZPW0_9BACT|nr:hypothetical protein [Oceanidesulfovibrio marinus]TVM36585.1 hypothetical protein DQK91_01270 [Oceanidesulfovibrio marinus]